ncbi:glycoside hydrolase family 3 C-terminal domain-containing protein [Acidipila sp. EB88]|uniref:glycoside hydrolase family 3 C-terminal domain-containing protein n=1 Tax=Acidipila sp. EB88 TaxID=2305226 RepID=UPI000F5E6558|nr:glycoside hydrolase family 3 C-terminal domain-containing protein [Acidipila sp. EB88]RRA50271.1 beta-glucosidase [Acidipila sp. EB88]
MQALMLVAACAASLSCAPLTAQTADGSEPAFRNVSLAPETRIDDLLKQMTLEEKIACLGTNTSVPRLKIRSFGSSEGIHGVVERGDYRKNRQMIPTTQFPQPPGMGETWDPALVQEAAGVEGAEGRFISDSPKYNEPKLMLWGPQADLARDPRWGRTEEVYGEDPFLNGSMVVHFVMGLQGPDPNHWQAAALLKHFLANSNEDLRTKSNSIFDERLFWEYYSVPFRMGFTEGGARGVMASYNAWNGTPMVVNPILKSIVEEKWGVDVLSSDGGAVKLLWTDHKKYPDQKSAVIACLHAGINQFLDQWKDETTAAVKEGSVSEAELDALLRRKFLVSLKLGLLDPGVEYVAPTEMNADGTPPAGVPASANAKATSQAESVAEPWDSEKDRDVSRRMALESVTLLKNEGGTLPLERKSIKSIAVIGPLADSVRWDWYGGTPPYAVTPLDGIKAALGPYVRVNYAANEDNQAAINAARMSDVAIVVVGNDPTCGADMGRDWHATVDGGGTLACSTPSDGREGRDRESLQLEQEQLVKQVIAVNPRTVMVLVSSFSYTINWSQKYVPAILHMTHSSQDEGTALAKVIFGEYNPAGHLTTTWPASEDQLPPMMDYNIRDGRTYMYSKGTPLYPFGFGLSYTTFRYRNLRVSESTMRTGETDNVTVDVTNTGSRDGDEVVQLYVSHQGSKVARPLEELKGFQRVHVATGQTVPVTIPLKADDLRYWNEVTHGWTLEPDRVELRVGASSADIRGRKLIEVQP